MFIVTCTVDWRVGLPPLKHNNNTNQLNLNFIYIQRNPILTITSLNTKQILLYLFPVNVFGGADYSIGYIDIKGVTSVTTYYSVSYFTVCADILVSGMYLDKSGTHDYNVIYL